MPISRLNTSRFMQGVGTVIYGTLIHWQFITITIVIGPGMPVGHSFNSFQYLQYSRKKSYWISSAGRSCYDGAKKQYVV
jgi:hypothetical protein